MSIDELLRHGEQRLAAAGVDSPAADAALLLAHACGMDGRSLSRARLMGDPVPAEAAASFDALLARRARRVPVQHITGEAHFRTLTLPVGPGVFVPRPETELLVDPVLAHLASVRPSGGARVLDLCTGTGALGLAVAAEAAGTSAVGIEADPTAAGWARRSADAVAGDLARAGSDFAVVEADATDPEAVRAVVDAHLTGRADVVVANPPYVVADGTTTAPEVVDHDPARALWGGGDDGTRVPRLVIAAAAPVLPTGGLLVLEHADTQGAALREAFLASGFAEATTRADYTGRDRFTLAVRQPHTQGK
ncbi:peptide chain release factor N(5)-glutamine methyltransferase [Brevibacterium yomogidense]|uniref:Release factor glutamine methyltransferase n=1 Tax=Brevibacterium yomogidense TaxID=946573 RepID=A0A1X6XMA7_9MICO|nr:peptide chain release factor N(5)-glutamine methyltransferase [Brevibacterium yomogidense]SLN00273.1 Protein-N(5)-glutamine methyltransferase PrmC, methylates polypeptide chain release factors RF1 and RF2 [Brevibacterium yomogidense]